MKIVKQIALVATVLVLALSNVGCNKIVEPGTVGIKVKQTGSERGVQDYPVLTGRVFYNPVNEDVLVWPVNVRRAAWTHDVTEGHPSNEEISFQSKEGMHFTADVAVSYELRPEKVPHFYMRFRNDDMDGFTHGFLRDTVRNGFAVSTAYTAEEINGPKQNELMQSVVSKVTEQLEPIGVHIVQIGFIAPPRPPDAIKQSIDGKIAAIQNAERIENEKRAAIAEGEKTIALAEAEAKANDIKAKSITQNLVEWRKLDILERKWNGGMPMVQGSGSSFLLDLRSSK